MTSLSVTCYRYDYGILALKYMEFWNGATLSTSLVKVKAGLQHFLLFSSILSHNTKSVVLIRVG